VVSFTNYTYQIPTNYSGLIMAGDSYTGNMLSIMLLVFVFGTVFLTLYGRGNENAFMAACVTTAITSIFMMVFSSISPAIVLICIVISAISIYALPKER
jgi:hypothetical protein